MIRQLRVALLLLALLPAIAHAQSQTTGPVRLSSATCPGSGCVTLGVGGVGGVAVQVTGTYSGTLTFEGTVTGATWVPINLIPIAGTTPTSTTTSTGVWNGGVGGLAIVRVRMSSYSSGAAVVTIQNAPSSARGGGSGGGGGGAPADATYITQTADSTLTAEQPIAALASGILRGATTTGVITSLGDQLPLANGGTAANLTDPNADRILFWDDSAGAVTWLTAGSGLTITTTTLTADGTFGGSIANTQVAIGTGANTIGGESAFNYNAATDTLQVLAVGDASDWLTLTTGTFLLPTNVQLGYPVVNQSNSTAREMEVYIDDESIPSTFAAFKTTIASTEDVNTSWGALLTLNQSGDIAGAAIPMHMALNVSGTAVVVESIGYNLGHSLLDTAHVNFAYGDYREFNKAAGASIDDLSVYWANNITGQATRGYYFWLDAGVGSDCNSGGVYRVNDFGISAYYNPCFAKYTPGLANFERIISRWGDTGVFGVDNRAYLGVEVGGTGTNRPVNLIGANYSITSTLTPAVTNTTANSCGTSPATIAGNDNAGKVTVGATAGTSCTVTFATAFSNAPSCSVTNETTANLSRATSTTTTVILAGTFAAGDSLAYVCLGR